MTASSDLRSAIADFRRGDLAAARAGAERALAAGAGAEARHLLGLTLCRLGAAADGIPHLEAALAEAPGHPGYRLMLARALVDAGRPADALALTDPLPPAIAAAPAQALPFWQLRAEAGEAAGDLEEARSACRALLAAVPHDARARLHAAELERRLGDPAAALALADEGIALAGPGAGWSRARARALVALTRFAEAEAAYRDALDRLPGDRDSLVELGLLLERTGSTEALAALVEAAALPAADVAYFRATLALSRGDPAEARRQLGAGPPALDPARWFRLEVRIAEALGDADGAWEAALAMNAAVPDRADWRARGGAYRARLRHLAERLAALPPPGPAAPLDPAAPIFLVGFPRSGTTLLDTFLMGHPRLVVTEEQPMLDAAERALGGIDPLAAPEPLVAAARAAYRAEQARHAALGPGQRLVDKLPLNILGMALVTRLFPGAPIVFAQRHPCDCVLSGLFQSFVLNEAMAGFLDPADAADFYDAVLSLWRASRERLPLAVHTIVYERLVADHAATLRPLVDWLGLEWDEALLDHQKTARDRGPIITPSYDQVTKPISARQSGRWRRYEDRLAPELPVLLGWADWLGYGA